ncbi:type IV pilus twitching motility protein PilT [Salinibacillus xinjiangensis]|uniref:PilT/PilU family type 4a pilus ATPase n=1 Tax=Salinibacillus xinjiangensis TaxID=1229268 RepID=A0A6G1X973_9BACI|nr:type IV pilus twitching motility protein PilT [Salinibacillus xinjiangensis]MRG87492.1 PilT/PilU family type 4a pilus ATPase [Salinibacillus xinjiangensis]
MKEKLDDLLYAAYKEEASDVHLTVGLPPIFRVHGQLKRLDKIPYSQDEMLDMAFAVMSESLKSDFEQNGEVDFSYELIDISRFRINVYKQRNGVSIAIRLVPSKVPTIKDLMLPDVLTKIAKKPQGLVLVTGPTGSGKSTTLAAMIDFINEHQQKHIITLEDPIEYIHQHKQSVIEQREVGRDTQKFSSGLRASLRQDPDVILVGEMRDLETISTAVTAAETGHLVFGTLHTISAPATIERIVDVFPAEQQAQIRYQLASVLVGVISQRLFPLNTGNGRIAATEILVQNNAVSSLIRNHKIHQLPNLMQTSRDLGMHTLEMNIKSLLQRQLVSRESVQGYLGEHSYGSI